MKTTPRSKGRKEGSLRACGLTPKFDYDLRLHVLMYHYHNIE